MTNQINDLPHEYVQKRLQTVRFLGYEDREGLLPIGSLLQEDAVACM